ncbi:gamma-aminobutyric acid type B receptor subunit 2-like, partial [Paramacrobiotus metropolitanus]|uniref:gamma-aminobutyric acid type B receptor subunit 2-like n=1 Tax=Paramacrobiotus metropolitanus TaxID=2943436 RepID=UPI0024456A88
YTAPHSPWTNQAAAVKKPRNSPAYNQLPAAAKELLIAGLFPLALNSDSGRLGRGVLPAALLARDHINQRHNLLKGYELQLDVNDTACDAALGIKAFLDMLYKKPGRRLMVFGSACTEVTGPIAQASQFLHLAQLSYADTHPMYDHYKFPNLYRIVPSENQFNFARLELLRQFNWTYIATLYQNEPRYSLAHNHLMSRAKDVNPPYKLLAQSSFTDITEIRSALDRFQQRGARILFGSFSERWARIIFCEAYTRQMYGRKYQWIIWGGYNEEWWRIEDPENLNCTTDELVTALNGYISTDILPLSLDKKRHTEAGLDAGSYEKLYNRIRQADYSRFHGYTYDGVWAMAKAISIVLNELPPWESIEDFNYKSEKWSKRFLEALNDTEFIGVTGPVKFFQNERVGSILINQFQVISDTVGAGKEEIIALYENESSTLNFSVGRPIFWHGKSAPRDSTYIENRLEHLNLATFITMTTLAIAGVILAVTFLVINVKYRNHKYIKMSSPYLNNVIIFGCIMTYLSVILLGIDTGLVDMEYIPAVCTARLWVLTIGFTLAFGAMFSKTWRVHAIFTNIKLNKKVIKDYQLFLIVAVLLVADLVILLTWQLQDPFRFALKNLTEFEDITNDYLIKPQIAYCISENNTIYLGVTYAFKGILMAFGCFLAWETRHVSIPALNDSKYIGMSVYNVVIMCVIGAAISIILTDQQEYAFIIISVFIIFCTTITLCLVFVPKILELRRNPNPEAKRVRATLKPAKSSKRESFSADLQNRIKNLQDQNSKLKEAHQAKLTDLNKLVSELGEEARDILQQRKKSTRPRPKINFKGLPSDDDDDDNSSVNGESSQDDQSDHWPLVETSAVTKCVYVHYRPRKNSVEAVTVCTNVSEPSSNSHRPHLTGNSLPPITDVEESELSSKHAVTPAKDTTINDIFGGVYIGGAPPPAFRRPSEPKAEQKNIKSIIKAEPVITENHVPLQTPNAKMAVTLDKVSSISGDEPGSIFSDPDIDDGRTAAYSPAIKSRQSAQQGHSQIGISLRNNGQSGR